MGRTFSSNIEQRRARTAIARTSRTRPSSDRGARLGLHCRRSKAGVRIETRPTQPIERAIAPEQGGGFAIADQCVILDTRGHDALRHEIDDHLDVTFAVLERLTPALKRDRVISRPSQRWSACTSASAAI